MCAKSALRWILTNDGTVYVPVTGVYAGHGARCAEAFIGEQCSNGKSVRENGGHAMKSPKFTSSGRGGQVDEGR